MSQAYWSEWNWIFHIDHWSADDTGWSVSFALPSTHRGQPPTDSQNFVPDRWVFFWEDHSGQWTCPTGSLPWSELFGSWLHMPGHTWWNGLLSPEHFPPGLSQVPGIENPNGLALRDEWPQCFREELLAAWPWKLDRGDTSQCAPLPGQPYEARRTCHAWDPACIPGPNGQPHCGIP